MAAPPTYNDAVGYPGQGQPQQPAYGGYAPPPQPGYGQAAVLPPGSGYAGGYPPQQGGYKPPNASGYGTQYGGQTNYDNQSYGEPLPDVNTQPVSSSEGQDESDFGENFGRSLSDKAIRRAFIRKVYLILTAQLSVTVAFIALFLFVQPLKDWVRRNSWFYYLSYATFLVTYITLICCPSVRRKTPGNFICLAVFTFAFSYMTATITSFYDTEIVLIAAGITCLVCLSITLFAVQTKFDFTMCAGLLFACSMVLFFFGIACFIVYMTVGYSHILNCVYAGLAAMLFCLFLAFDTQMVIGGKKYQLSEEEYIFGALQLYLDIVYIFLMLLSLVGAGKN
ncbi:protein lifeguard 3-like [Tubulanus polymorphus]|uniref:protein lifeguard 3-like n=1 Tax=Tubulanus polymorphus TaxID=672921 RepID=UPI003DA2ABB0